MTHPLQRLVKELMERAAAGVLLVGLSPLLAALSVLIKADSPGSILYRQQRVGLYGHPFELLKLRTMTVGAEQRGLRWEISRDDRRITRIGRILRRSSLDELPQLINVLRGDMALVGPRPALPHHVERYTPRQRRRLEVKPGLTGLAQVSGRNNIGWDERIELDVWYIDHWSLALDIQILVRTPSTLLNGVGVYGQDGVVREKR